MLLWSYVICFHEKKSYLILYCYIIVSHVYLYIKLITGKLIYRITIDMSEPDVQEEDSSDEDYELSITINLK